MVEGSASLSAVRLFCRAAKTHKLRRMSLLLGSGLLTKVCGGVVAKGRPAVGSVWSLVEVKPQWLAARW